MTKFVLTVVIFLSICASTCFAGNSTQADCQALSGRDCQTCLANLDCGYCGTAKTCFLYRPSSPFDAPCPISDQKYQTCIGNFKVWAIVIGVVVGIVVLTVIVLICCFCRKCKKRSVRREERRQERQQQQVDQQSTERQAAAEARTAERADMADQLRMKYGILKEKENTDYTRFP